MATGSSYYGSMGPFEYETSLLYPITGRGHGGVDCDHGYIGSLLSISITIGGGGTLSYADDAACTFGTDIDFSLLYVSASDDFRIKTGATNLIEVNKSGQIFYVHGAATIAGALTGTSTAAFTTSVTAASFIIGANTLDTNEWAFLDGQNQAVASTSSPTFNALTVTSIAIGANTLTTSEFGYLDGQNQAVKTTSSPTFAGITATSITMGGVVLTYSEWFYLDEQDQTVNTGSSPTFVSPKVTTIEISGYVLSSSEFSFLDGINQTVATTSSPTFVDLTLTGGDLIASTATTFNVFNTVATTINAFGASAATTIGDATTSTTTLRGGTLVGNTTTQNAFNTTATTLNIGGAATTIRLAGSASGTVNLGTNDTQFGRLDIHGHSDGTSGVLNLYNGVTYHGGGADSWQMRGYTLSGDFYLSRNTGQEGLFRLSASTGDATILYDLAVNGGDLTTTASTFNLVNATATTVNIGGAATAINFGGASSAAIITPGNKTGAMSYRIYNSNAGTDVYAQIGAGNGSGDGALTRIITLGTGFTTTGAYFQDGGILVADTDLSGGLSIAARHASGDVRIYAGGTASGDLVATFDNTQGTTLTGNLVVTGDATCDELTLTTGLYDYKFTSASLGIIDFQNLSAGQAAVFQLRAQDDDGTDSVYFVARKQSGQGMIIGWDASRYNISCTGTADLYIGTTGNYLFHGASSPTSAVGAICIKNGTAPTSSPADQVQIFAADVAASSELRVRDEGGTTTTLSPHNFSQIPNGKSEDMAWSYYSERDGKYINADMTKALRLVEKLTGEKIIYTGQLAVA